MSFARYVLGGSATRPNFVLTAGKPARSIVTTPSGVVLPIFLTNNQ